MTPDQQKVYDDNLAQWKAKEAARLTNIKAQIQAKHDLHVAGMVNSLTEQLSNVDAQMAKAASFTFIPEGYGDRY